MATFFSNHFTTTGIDQTSLPTLPSDAIPDARRKHGRLRVSRALVTITDNAAGDVARMLTLRSDAQLHSLCLYSDSGFSASSAADVGIFLSGDAHDGAAVDAVLFHTALDITASIDAWDAAEIFTGAVLDGEDRGKTLWELADVGAATITADPRVLYDIGVTLNGNDDNTVSTLVMVAYYTAGD